jgi:activator of 2-hydroxyglutaryl-CoA dehydratase
MDTLKSLFGICSIEEACEKAFVAENASPINATCAVFLMENAKKLQTK